MNAKINYLKAITLTKRFAQRKQNSFNVCNDRFPLAFGLFYFFTKFYPQQEGEECFFFFKKTQHAKIRNNALKIQLKSLEFSIVTE